MAKIIVQNTEITVLSQDEKDYISLIDMANGKHDESHTLTPFLKWSNLTTLLHEKEWRKDKIGKKLCEIYKKSSSSSFEDGF